MKVRCDWVIPSRNVGFCLLYPLAGSKKNILSSYHIDGAHPAGDLSRRVHFIQGGGNKQVSQSDIYITPGQGRHQAQG